MNERLASAAESFVICMQPTLLPNHAARLAWSAVVAVALRTSGGAGRFRSAPTYDAVGSVTRVATTFNGTQTDTQAFCYDESNRLSCQVWSTMSA